MIPKTRQPEISEFMTGTVVNTYWSSSSSMDVYIPILMMDKGASNIVSNLGVPNIFVSAENIRTSSMVGSKNFITARVSPVIPHLNAGERTPGYPKGTQVRLYIPQLDLDQAIIVPM